MNLLHHKRGRNLAAFAFYFAEGVPIGFIWWAMPALLRQNGVAVDVIGSFTAILTLPWVFKFLWAPLVDFLRSSRFGFVHWIAVAQTMMCLTLLPLVFIPLDGNVFIWGALLFLHSLCAATQDVAVDALVINVVAAKEKGLLNGYMQAGMLIGRSLFGGGALYFLNQAGLSVTIGFMILAILVVMLLLIFIKEPLTIQIDKGRFKKLTINLKQVFNSKTTWYAIGFALTAAAAFEAIGAFAGPYFTDLKISQQSIGFFFAVPVVVSMLLGGLAGGFLSDRIARKKAVALFLCGFVLMAICISFLGLTNIKVPHFISISLFSVMYFFTGMFTAASYALFMDVTTPKLAATQFSTLMAATNGCEAWVVFISGMIAHDYGYNISFLAMCLVSLLSLFFLRMIKGG